MSPAHHDVPRLLLVDDEPGKLEELVEAVRGAARNHGIAIDAWCPEPGDSVTRSIAERLAEKPTLVVTDHDLTENGPPGFLGDSIVAACRGRAIPVGDYSRKVVTELTAPDPFEFRFDRDPAVAATQIVELLLGFHALETAFRSDPRHLLRGNWSKALASVVGRDDLSGSLSMYAIRTGAAPRTLLDRLGGEAGRDRESLYAYLAGHILHNGIMRYPGPLLRTDALWSYLAVGRPGQADAERLAEAFSGALYQGPFAEFERFYWQDRVEDLVLDLGEELGVDDAENPDEYRRAVALAVAPGVPGHACGRCGGTRGGYRCPYTDRTVCDRTDCSVASSSWIPQGAYLTRVEKDFYEEWAPMVGL